MKKFLMKSKHVVLLLLITLLTIGCISLTSANNLVDVNAETSSTKFEKSYFSLDYENNELKLLFSSKISSYQDIKKADFTELKEAIIEMANDIIFASEEESSTRSKKRIARFSGSNIGSEVDVSLVEKIINGQINNVEVVEGDLLESGTYDTLLKFYVDRYTDEYINQNPTATADDVLDTIKDSITTAVNEKVSEVYEAEGIADYAPTADVTNKINTLIEEVKDLKADNKSVEITLDDVTQVFNVIGVGEDVTEVINTIDVSSEVEEIIKNSTGEEITNFLTEVDIDEIIEVTKNTNIIVKDTVTAVASKVGVDNIVKIADTIGTDKLKELAKTVDISTDDVNQIIKDNISDLTLNDILKMLTSIKVDGEYVYNNKEVVYAGVKKIISNLPKLSEIANYTDDEMRVSWDVEIESMIGTKSFKLTVGFDGDCTNIRKIAKLIADHVNFYKQDGVYHLEITTPFDLADLVLAACNSENISDNLKQRLFNDLALNINDLYNTIQALTIQDVISLLKEVDYKSVVNKLIDPDYLNNLFNTTIFTDAKIDTILQNLINIGKTSQKLSSDDIQNTLNTVFGNSKLNISKFTNYINKALFFINKVNFDNITVERIRNFADPSSSSTNSKIYSYIDKLANYEDEFNKVKEYLTKFYNKIPDTYKEKSLFDLYDGSSEFSFKKTFNVEGLLDRLSTASFNLKDALGIIVDQLPETISVDINLLANDFYKVEYVIGSTTKTGFLPVGASLQLFAQETEINGHAITKWIDADNNEYDVMPSQDIKVYAVTEFSVQASEDVSKTYDKTASTISVTVDGDESITYNYQWYKDGKAIDGATSSEYEVTNVKDSGEYYCVVSTDTGYNESSVIKVEIKKATVNVSEFTWDYTSEITYDEAEHTVAINNLPETVTVSYEGEKGTNANTYNAVATFELVDEDNYELSSETLALEWKIGQALITVSNLEWSVNKSVVYTGTEFVATITNLPDNVTATYQNNTGINVGTYKASATLAVDENHKLAKTEYTYTWKVTEKEVELPSIIEWSVNEQEYTGEEIETTISTELPEEVEVTYTNNKYTNASVYQAVATFTVDSNHKISKTQVTHEWKITQKVITVNESDLQWSISESTPYTGNEIKNVVTNTIENVNFMYSNNKGTKVGSYTAKVILTTDSNHKLSQNTFEKEWEITKAVITIPELTWTVSDKQTYTGDAFEALVTNMPEGVSATYTNYKGTNAGEYTTTVEIKAVDDNYEVSKSIVTKAWVIEKAEITLPTFTWSVKDTQEYTGKELVATITNLPNGVKVEYTNNKGTSVGDYTTTATLSVDDNHKISESSFTLSWKITQKEIKLSTFAWSVKDTQEYTGKKLVATITNLPNGVSAVYANNEATNAGEYTTTVKLSVSDSNYYIATTEASKTWKIEQVEITLPTLAWSVKDSQDYTGKEFVASITNLPKGVEVVYANDKATNAGEYTTTATLSVDSNHKISTTTVTFNWKINVKTIYISSVSWDYYNPFTYDGNAHKVQIIGLPENVKVSYENNEATKAGKYVAKATLSIEDSNYKLSQTSFTCDWEIKEVVVPVEPKTNFETEDGSIKITSKNGVDSDHSLDVSDKSDSCKDIDVSSVLNDNEKGHVEYALDIHFEKNGSEVQVNDDFTVRMLIPEKLLDKAIKVVHIDDAGNVTDVEFVRDGDYVVFKAAHFSIYAIVLVTEIHAVPWIVWVVVALLVIFVIGLIVAIYLKRKGEDEEEEVAEEQVELVEEQVEPVEEQAEQVEEQAESVEEQAESVEEQAEQVEEQAEQVEEQAEQVEESQDTEVANFEEEKPTEVPEAETENDKFEDSYFGNLINAEDNTKGYYAILKKEILSYELDDQKVETKISWNNETFMFNGEMVARFKMRNNKLYVSLPLSASEYLEDAKDSDSTFNCCIKNSRRCKYTKGLISTVMNKFGLSKKTK